ncbi:hypothetical protein G7046_g7030 [Stylonectria norvegica]|nr:hypothetical protein G7046_g7030 [Stylonectria norvegica]
MSDGKKVVWEIADPTRVESVFHPLIADMSSRNVPAGYLPVAPGALPEPFYELCGLTSTSSAETNPYHVAASILAQLMPQTIDDDNLLLFLTFLSQLDQNYRTLLTAKDPAALLLLVWWYAKVVVLPTWWMQRRTIMEGKSLCLYLERSFKDQPEVLGLLNYPRRVIDAVANSGGKVRDGVFVSTGEAAKQSLIV